MGILAKTQEALYHGILNMSKRARNCRILDFFWANVTIKLFIYDLYQSIKRN